MARAQSALTDEQWALMAPLWPERNAAPPGGLKPIPNRPVSEGSLWLWRAGARWQDLPKRCPSPSTYWRRIRDWEEQGIWIRAWQAWLAQLDAQGQRDWAEAFADGSFAPAKNGEVRREHDAWPRDEGDGGGRRPRCASGTPLGLGVPGRGRPAGADHGDHRRPTPWSRTPPQEARAAHRR
jgi:transposase